MHYLPNKAVIRKDDTTTEVRIVYDASSKEKKSERLECLPSCGTVAKPIVICNTVAIS